MPVRKADLGPLAPISEGAFGKVYRADGFTLPGDTTPLAYKEFTSQQAVQARAARAAVVFRDGLSAADRADLDSCCAWPRALVESENGSVCGLLMMLIPPDFFCELADPDTGNRVSRPREMGWLIASAAQRQAAEVDLAEVDLTERLLLVARLVYAIGRLHKHDWVFGDLSFKNAVFALDPPRVLLLDCDGAAALSDLSRHQPSTPHWEPPECARPGQARSRKLQDAATDTYKLGLAILRCLTPGKGASTAKRPERLSGSGLDAEGVQLVARALGDDPDARPTAKELYACLRALVRQRIKPPEIAWAWLTAPVVLRDQAVQIKWRISNARRVTVTAGTDFTAEVELAGRPDEFTFNFRPDGSGTVRLRAANRFGTVTADLGEITVIDLPPFTVSFDGMPEPRIPPLEALSLEPVAAALADGPATRGLMPEAPQIPVLPDVPPISLDPSAPQIPSVPPVPAVDVTGLFRNLLASRPAALTGPGIDHAVTRVTAVVGRRIQVHLDRLLQEHLRDQQKGDHEQSDL
jgi:hypothetical protein